LWKVSFRLYRRRFFHLDVKIIGLQTAACFEIYKLDALLHRSILSIYNFSSVKSNQTLSFIAEHFYGILQYFWEIPENCWKPGYFAEFTIHLKSISDSVGKLRTEKTVGCSVA